LNQGLYVFFCTKLYLVDVFEDCGENQRLVDAGVHPALIRCDSDFEGLGAAGKTTL